MKVKILCEQWGVIRDAFIAAGHDAVSVDIEPTRVPGPHIQDDALNHLDDGDDLIIANPECKYVCFSGEQWRTPGHRNYIKGHFRKRIKGMGFLMKIMNAKCDLICVENSHSVFLNRYFRPSDQIVQPWFFGDPEQKQTHLWLKGLPPLMATGYPDHINHSTHMMAPGPERSILRAKTFKGLADAMVNQWGSL